MSYLSSSHIRTAPDPRKPSVGLGWVVRRPKWAAKGFACIEKMWDDNSKPIEKESVKVTCGEEPTGFSRLPWVPSLRDGDVTEDLWRQAQEAEPRLTLLAFIAGQPNATEDQKADFQDVLTNVLSFSDLPAQREARAMRSRTDWRVKGQVSVDPRLVYKKPEAKAFWGSTNSFRLSTLQAAFAYYAQKRAVAKNDLERSDLDCLLEHIRGRQEALRARAWDKRGGRHRGARGGRKR